jgi:pimeloyl-ACP methyl ester carboxylesterase
MPIAIIAGEDDRLIDINKQSARFIPTFRCAFHRVPDRPHDPSDSDGEVMAARNEVAGDGP